MTAKVMIIEQQTKKCDKLNRTCLRQNIGLNSTLNSHMRLSIRHPLSNKRHNLDFGGYVCGQPEGWKKKGLNQFRVPLLFFAMFLGDF